MGKAMKYNVGDGLKTRSGQRLISTGYWEVIEARIDSRIRPPEPLYRIMSHNGSVTRLYETEMDSTFMSRDSLLNRYSQNIVLATLKDGPIEVQL